MEIFTNILLLEWIVLFILLLSIISAFIWAVYRRYTYKSDTLSNILITFVLILFVGFSGYLMVKSSDRKYERIGNEARLRLAEEKDMFSKHKAELVIAFNNKSKVYFEHDPTLRLIDSISVDTSLIFSNNMAFKSELAIIIK